ncbi:protein disulfide-isomerase 5-1 [Salvia miltiorrhiza]|uniref:protein disulfide-isomerase 5-1 n=1 Tax=Salvia miltiorrhiza TaxID=226208 RepID=UPI0025ABAB31|nr:protein disulfide-isomerase 5-1 [Salvia miltiorrhiza]
MLKKELQIISEFTPKINTKNLGLFFGSSLSHRGSYRRVSRVRGQLHVFSSIAMRRRLLDPSFSVLLLFFSSIFILSSISNRSVNAEVITLNSEIFNDKMQEKDTAWFVKFCVPWCKHCKNLGTLWEDLGKEMEGEDEIEIGEVDCGTDKPVCSKVDIHSYPTFKLFYNGEEVAKYQGTRDVESLKRFALEETVKAATKAQLEDDAEL